MAKVCRLCMQTLNKSFINIDTIEHATGEKPFRKKIALLLPEVALDITPYPLICFVCAQALHAAYVFKTQCLEVEEQVRAYVKDMAAKNNSYDLSNIVVKPFMRMTFEKAKFDEIDEPVLITKEKKVEVKQIAETYDSPSCSEEVLEPPYPTVKIEVSDLNYEDEIEFQDENDFQEENDSSAQSAGNEEDPFLIMDTSFLCNFCGFQCNDQDNLMEHMTTHNALPQCPWCQRHFKSETFLNTHKNNCLKRYKMAKMKVPEPDPNNLCAKVPRLPRQAKHYLETWLYEHQEDPYPTDGEKLKMAEDTNLTLIQVQNWFINARRRILKGNYCKKYFRKKRSRGGPTQFQIMKREKLD